MTSQHGTAAVLLDLDGVVRFFPPEDEADACVAAGLPPGSVLETAFRPGNLDPAISGSVRDDEWRRAVAWDLEEAFDAVVSSAETGVPKPEPGAYRAGLDVVRRLLGREPEPAEVLVIDDSATNVAAAQALGPRGYHAVTRGVLPVLP